MGLDVNGAGPMLVRSDPARNRVVLVNTLTSSVSLLSGADRSVVNVPISGRVPQYLKGEILALVEGSGLIYLVGERALHVVDPARRTSRAIPTGRQMEAVAIDEASGDAFLVGRSSGSLGIVRAGAAAPAWVPFAEQEETLVNLNMTPPPPIRKVVFEPEGRRVLALDGYTSTLVTFDAASGREIARRTLPLISGARWHLGGFDRAAHRLYLAVETAERKVVQAAAVDTLGERDLVVDLPGLTEGVGVVANPRRGELYIAYDNHPTVHVIAFAEEGAEVVEIKVPAYGNDAVALDAERDTLYVASWAWGEVDRIDLAARRLVRRYTGLGVLPHQFSMAFNTADGKLYLPLGATAVNGSFGAALTVLDPATGTHEKVRTGWAPVDAIQRPGHESFLVFSSEDQMAEVWPDGRVEVRDLSALYPHQAVRSADGNVLLSYGPHQSYWPVVYIWGARNGVLTIDPATLATDDRRIPELSQGMVVDRAGALWSLQNNWGRQKQYLITLPDDVRAPNLGDMRVELDDEVERETSQRILAYDAALHRLYIGRIGETDAEPGVLQVLDVASRKVIRREVVGLAPADVAFDERRVFVANFDSGTVTVLEKEGGRTEVAVGAGPLKLAALGGTAWVINHLDGTLQQVVPGAKAIRVPAPGRPDNLAAVGDALVLTVHSGDELSVLRFHPRSGRFETLARERYPFGDTRFDSGNTAFYQRGQMGDAIFEITRIRHDDAGRLWVTDLLAGRLLVIGPPVAR